MKLSFSKSMMASMLCTLGVTAAKSVETTSLRQLQTENLVQTLVGNADYSTLVTAVTTAGLAEALSADGPFTVFGPDNTAFGAVPEELLTKLLTPPWAAHLTDILLFHATDAGALLSSDIPAEGAAVTMLNGESIAVNLTADGGVTVSVRGEVAANVNLPNIEASNGAFHGIDAVLLPSAMVTTMYDALSAVPDLSTLKSLVDLAGLQDTLATADLTAFAPTNTAFEAVDADTITFLTDPANVDQLTSILTYHVLPEVLVSAAINETSYTTVNGAAIDVAASADGVIINGVASVASADNLVSNGVVHLIDAVLLPPTTVSNETAMDPSTDTTTGNETDVGTVGDEAGADEDEAGADEDEAGVVGDEADADKDEADADKDEAGADVAERGASGASRVMGIMGVAVCVVFSALV